MKTKPIVIVLALIGGVLSLVALCTSSNNPNKQSVKAGNTPVITIPSLQHDFWPNKFIIKEEEDEQNRLPEFIEPV